MTSQSTQIKPRSRIEGVTANADSPARLASLALVASGVCFFLYPALRPFSDETTLAGARAFASSQWVVAHSLGIGAFALLAAGMLGPCLRFAPTAESRSRWALFLTVIGAGLVLPYYGAEVFGLHAIGSTSLDRNNADLFTTLTDGVRWGPGIWFIVSGLVLLAIGGILAASASWVSKRGLARWSGIPLAAGLVLYLPQFTGPQWVRVLHGALMAVGCALLAWAAVDKGRSTGRSTTEA